MAIACFTIGALVALPALSSSFAAPVDSARGVAVLPRAQPPTLVRAEPTSLTLRWTQPPPDGFDIEAYEVEIRHGEMAVLTYIGSDEVGAFAPLPPSSSFCARVRLRLQPAGAQAAWSECATVATAAAVAPEAPGALEALATWNSGVIVGWPEPSDVAGAPVDALEFQFALLVAGLVDECEWTGATCNAGCAELAGGRNWTLAESSWQGAFAECRGANELGCCGLACWCYSYRCCEPRAGIVRADPRSTALPPVARNVSLSLPAGQAVALTVRAHNRRGWSGWSPELVVHADALDTRPPDAPSLLLERARARSLALRWAAPDSDGGAMVVAYDVVYAPLDPAAAAVPAEPPADARAVRVGGAALVSTLNSLEPVRVYAVWVRALNSRGPSAWAVLRARTLEQPPPPPPRALRVVLALSDAVGVAWQSASRGGADAANGGAAAEAVADVVEHEVEVVDANGSSLNASCTALPPATSCTVVGLSAETPVRVRARSRSADGWGEWSEAVAAQTEAVRGCLQHADHARVLAERAALHASIERCGRDCWAGAECVSRCVARSGVVSPLCAGCMGAVSACTKDFCLDKCALDPDGLPCRECARANCFAEYATCVGVPEVLVP